MQPVLREWKRAAGGTYHAVLRHEITTRLGWEWHEPRYGMAELARWPKPVLRVFSRRREQIEAFLAGETPTWARAQLANSKTRLAKQHARDERGITVALADERRIVLRQDDHARRDRRRLQRSRHPRRRRGTSRTRERERLNTATRSPATFVRVRFSAASSGSQ